MGRVTKAPVRGAPFTDAGARDGATFRFAVCAVAGGRSSSLSAASEWEDGRPGELLREGEEAKKGGKSSKAAEAFRRILREFPASRHVDRARKALGSLGGGASGAGGEMDDGVRRYIVLGDRWAEAGQKRRAADCYRRVIAMNPDGPAAEEARVRLARLGD